MAKREQLTNSIAGFDSVLQQKEQVTHSVSGILRGLQQMEELTHSAGRSPRQGANRGRCPWEPGTLSEAQVAA